MVRVEVAESKAHEDCYAVECYKKKLAALAAEQIHELPTTEGRVSLKLPGYDPAIALAIQSHLVSSGCVDRSCG